MFSMAGRSKKKRLEKGSSLREWMHTAYYKPPARRYIYMIRPESALFGKDVIGETGGVDT